jgi:hypothetical protein
LHSRNAALLAQVGTHAAPNVVVVAFGKQQLIQFTHPRVALGPGIVLHVFDAATVHPNLIAIAWVRGQLGFKDPGVVGRLGGQGLAAYKQLDPLRLWHPHPHHPTSGFQGLGPKDGEGVVVPAFGKPLAVLRHPIEAEQGHVPATFSPRA